VLASARDEPAAAPERPKGSLAMSWRLLWHCASSSPHTEPLIDETLPRARWETFCNDAESHGIAPLVYEALHRRQSEVPDEVLRVLRGLRLRHRRVAAARNAALAELTQAFREAHLDLLLLKGSALGPLLYPDAALRATRDVDLLTRPEEVDRAVACLQAIGYRTFGDPEWHHAAPLAKMVLGAQITIEVHRSLGIEDLGSGKELPGQTYDELAPRAQPVAHPAFSAATLGPEDTLWHVVRHGFMRRLFDDRFRLVSLADTVRIVETWLDRIDWDHVRRKDRQLLPALAMLHHLTPWSPRVMSALALRPGRPPGRVGECYYGWPRSRTANLFTTLWPAEWWLHLRYGGGPGLWGLARSAFAFWRELWFELRAARHPATRPEVPPDRSAA